MRILLLLALTATAPMLQAQSVTDAIARIKSTPIPQTKTATSTSGLVLPVESLPKKDWTVMVYMNSKNSLEKMGIHNMNAMELVGSTDKVNVVVEMGRMNGQDNDTHEEGDWTGTKRYYVQKDFLPKDDSDAAIQEAAEKSFSAITSPVYDKKSFSDMGNYNNAVDFIKWAKEKFPADRYMLILWNHGSGWVDSKQSEGKGIAYDDETGNFIRTAQIGTVLKLAGGVDVLAFDACLMQMFEIDYQLRDYAKVIVGSEETEPGLGFDYEGFLNLLTAHPSAKPQVAAKYIVASADAMYKSYYPKYRMPLTLSALDASKFETLRGQLDSWAEVAMNAADIDALKTARDNVIRFDQFGKIDKHRAASTFADLLQFVLLVGQTTKSPELKAKSMELAKAVADTVLLRSAIGKSTTGAEYEDSFGIAINIPRIRSDIPEERVEGKFYENKLRDFALFSGKWGEFYYWMMKNVPATNIPIEKRDDKKGGPEMLTRD